MTKPYQKLKQQSLVIAFLFIAITLVGIEFFPSLIVILVSSSISVVALSWRLFRALHRKIELQQFKVFRQLESLAGLYGTLDIQHPLPVTRHYAASPDFLHLMAREIFRLRPELILEAGSGASTLVAAYCLKKIGRGKIISVDNSTEYSEISRQTLKSHGLEEFAEVLHAPIKEYEIDGKQYLWYDTAGLQNIDRIDMAIVDGPPKYVAVGARYSVVPLLIDKMHENTILLLDDGARPDEEKNVSQWKQKYGLDYSFEPLEKGGYRCYFNDRG